MIMQVRQYSSGWNHASTALHWHATWSIIRLNLLLNNINYIHIYLELYCYQNALSLLLALG